MYKVFVVDDEIAIREGIRDNVRWENTNFILSGEAPDGEIALPLIQEIKPDILVTDIKMPFMDGLQLSRIIRKSMPWIKIIILSGYDEFDFAREAISIGINEYMLKPVSSSDLIEVLNKVAFQIEQEKKEREDAEKLRKQVESNVPLFRNEFLNKLVMGGVPPVEVIDSCSRYGINIMSKYYLAAIIEFDAAEAGIQNNLYSEQLKLEALTDSLFAQNPDVIRFKRNHNEGILIIKGDNQSSLEETAYSMAQAIKHEIERNTTFKVTISIGSVRERLQGISQSYRDAELVKKQKSIYGKNKIIGINDIKVSSAAKKEFVKIDKSNVSDFIKCGSKSDIEKFVEGYIKNLDDMEMKSLIYVYYIFMDIVMKVSRFVNDFGGDIESLIPEVVSLETTVASIDSIGKFKFLAESILTRVLEFRDSRVENKYMKIINKAREFINSNYSDPNISLNTVAANVNLSPTHFSTIFSQETGENFIEYLTKVRMKKAMEYLKTTTQKSVEIAYNVGYNDPHYFSYIFKKVVGITPKEFRSET
jgi:two-component system response regulator YesN